jgi:hypothetical protein
MTKRVNFVAYFEVLQGASKYFFLENDYKTGKTARATKSLCKTHYK